MARHAVVASEEWWSRRQQLLARETRLLKLRDDLSKARRALPWRMMEREYVFDAPTGEVTLAGLFEDRSQLLVYHFRFSPGWTEGCKWSSFIADHFNPVVVHLNHQDVTFVAVSRAPMEKLQAFRRRMGWTFKWVSSLRSGFDADFDVNFAQEHNNDRTYYDHRSGATLAVGETPGVSVFCKEGGGVIYHTYSLCGRTLDALITTYNCLDITPKGRGEGRSGDAMEWMCRQDRYGEDTFVEPHVPPDPAREP